MIIRALGGSLVLGGVVAWAWTRFDGGRVLEPWLGYAPVLASDMVSLWIMLTTGLLALCTVWLVLVESRNYLEGQYSSNRRSYAKVAEDFSRTRNRPWPEFEILRPYVTPMSRLLDIGCGNGRLRGYFTREMLRPGFYHGFDQVAELLHIARKRYPQDHFFQGDMREKLPFGDENFEVVTAIASFHHLLTVADQRAHLREVARVTKRGGKIFITTWVLPTKYRWRNWLRGRWRVWEIPYGQDKEPRYYAWVTESDLRKRLREAGLEVNTVQTVKGRNVVALATKPE